MRTMDVPPFPQKIEIADIGHLIRSRLSPEGRPLLLDQAIPLAAYMSCPNDLEERNQFMRGIRDWSGSSDEGPRRFSRLGHEWLRVADVFHGYYDLAQGGHQNRRGGPSIGKAITLIAANAKARGTGESALWNHWKTYKDVAHVITAAVMITADVQTRHRAEPFPLAANQFVPFQIVMLIPDLVLAVALEFERHGLSAIPHSREKPILDPETVWRIPSDINVTPIAPPARTIRRQDRVLLNARRAGNKMLKNRHPQTAMELQGDPTGRPENSESCELSSSTNGQ